MVKSLNLFCNSLPSNIFPSYLHSRWCRISAVNMNWFTVRHITLFLLSSSTRCFQLDLFSWYVFAYIVETIETCIMMLCICFCFAFLSKASQHTHTTYSQSTRRVSLSCSKSTPSLFSSAMSLRSGNSARAEKWWVGKVWLPVAEEAEAIGFCGGFK